MGQGTPRCSWTNWISRTPSLLPRFFFPCGRTTVNTNSFMPLPLLMFALIAGLAISSHKPEPTVLMPPITSGLFPACWFFWGMCTFWCWQYKVYSVLSLELSRFWQICVRTDGHYRLKADKRQFRALLTTHLHKLSAVQHCAECNSDYSFFIAAYFLLSKEPAV